MTAGATPTCCRLQAAREPRRRSVALSRHAAASSTCNACATRTRWRWPSSTPRPRPATLATTTSTVPEQDGFGLFDLNQRRGVRLSSSRAFLHPVLARPNLTVFADTLVEQVRLRGQRAVGLVVRHAWTAARARRARRGRAVGGYRQHASIADAVGHRTGEHAAAPWRRRCCTSSPAWAEPAGPPDGLGRGLQPGRRVVCAELAHRTARGARAAALCCSAGAACSPRTLPRPVASCAASPVSTGPTCSSPSWSA